MLHPPPPIMQIAASPVKLVYAVDTAVFLAITDQSAVGPVLIDNGLASSPSKGHPRLV